MQPLELSPGIYLFAFPDVAGNVVGNSVAIVMAHDVLLFDAALLPRLAAGEIRELARLTPKPVRYLVDSHWHPDHAGGNAAILAAFPQAEIIASRGTRALMQSTAKVYVRTLEFEAAQMKADIGRQLKSGTGEGGQRLLAAQRAELRAESAGADGFLAEFRDVPAALPTLAFERAMTLYHGGRELEFIVLPGHTAGDVVLYLPAEKLLLAGDLLAYPVPFCADSHPDEWIASLEALARLEADTIVPGHGPAMRDKAYLNLVLDALRSVREQVQAALGRGLTFEETQRSIDLAPLKERFTHGDPELGVSFDGNFAPVLRQMYDEATEGLERYQ